MSFITQPSRFAAIEPSTGRPSERSFTAATAAEIDLAAASAWSAFEVISARPSADRANLLDAAAASIERLGDDLVNTACRETGFAAPRIAGERDRTVFQLRMFAALVREGSWVEAIIDHGNPSRTPLPKPDLRRMLTPLGPVAVFGASNFPLAYSTAGGDTASALAAGCPVVVKGHPSHPATGELVAKAMAAAVARAGFPTGTFANLPAGGDRDLAVGQELVRHPAICGVGFTGSTTGGMALVALANARPEPIPVFAEMGSANPVFVLPGAIAADGATIADKLAASATASSGQMCTCPGLIFVVKGEATEQFVEVLAAAIGRLPAMVMLSPRIRSGYEHRLREIAGTTDVELLVGSANVSVGEGEPIQATAALLRTTLSTFRRHATLADECFGPAGVVVVCENELELVEAATLVRGSLTGSIWLASSDAASPLALDVRSRLARRVGRLIFNGVPTGVEVIAAIVHSGPFPSCNRPDTSAVGHSAIRRWCRPVCFQNTPDPLLPPELRENNPLGIERTVGGARTRPTTS